MTVNEIEKAHNLASLRNHLCSLRKLRERIDELEKRLERAIELLTMEGKKQ